jgi:hypothetical protein
MDVRYAEEADAKMIVVAGAVEKSIVELVDPNPTVALRLDLGVLPQRVTPPLPRSDSMVLGSSGMLSCSDACFSFPFRLSCA